LGKKFQKTSGDKIFLTQTVDGAEREQTSPRPKSQAKVVQYSNPDFRINLDSDPDVFRIASKMLWIHYFVGVAECRENQPVTIKENANKSSTISYSAMVREVEK